MTKHILVSICVTASFVAIAQTSFAGSDSHGGNSITCASNGINELLDYYEGAKTIAAKLDMGSDSASYADQIKLVLDRLAKIDPVAATRLQVYANNFVTEASFVTAAEIKVIIGDHNEIINPALGCTESQFAHQIANPLALQKRYYVNNDIWNSPNTPNHAKAGLILHEITYRDAIQLGQMNSDKTRYYNYLISSDFMNKVGTWSYVTLLEDAKFDRFADAKTDAYGNSIINPRLFSVKFENVVSYYEPDLDIFNHAESGLNFSSGIDEINFYGTKFHPIFFAIDKATDKLVAFSSGLKREALNLDLPGGKLQLSGLSEYVWRSAINPEYMYNFHLYQDGSLAGAETITPQKYKIQGVEINIVENSGIYFAPDHTVHKIFIEGGVTLKKADGSRITLDNGAFKKKIYLITLNSDELVTNVEHR